MPSSGTTLENRVGRGNWVMGTRLHTQADGDVGAGRGQLDYEWYTSVYTTQNTQNKCTNGQISVCTCWSTPQMLCFNKLKPCFTGPKSCEGHAVATPCHAPCTPAGQGMVQHHAQLLAAHAWPSPLVRQPESCCSAAADLAATFSQSVVLLALSLAAFAAARCSMSRFV